MAGVPRRVVDRVQRIGGISGALRGEPRVFTLPLEDVHPVVRIAHRMGGALNIPQRMIFDHELVLILGGSGVLTIRRRRVSFAANTLLFIPPFAAHRFESDVALPENRAAEHVAVHFDWARDVPPRGGLVQRRPYEVRLTGGLALPERLELPASHRAAAALVATVRAFGPDSIDELRASHHLTEALLELFSMQMRAGASGAARVQQARVDRAAQHAALHLTDALDVPQLAAIAGLSPSRFARIFHERTGYAPADYVRRLRVQRARELLGDINLSIKEIARATGFADVYTFSKVFRRVDGLSPTEYRAAALAGRR